MISMDFNMLSSNLLKLKSNLDNLKPKPLFYFNYLHRVLTERYEIEKPTYPMIIKIPKSNAHLLKNDFEPKQVITVNEPIKMTLSDKGEAPMWFSTTAEQAWLRFGYKNLDARYISDNKLNMEYIHGFLGGSSGHGKSVTLNSIIASLCFEYAPWELELHLSDAKIIEFKKYGVGHLIPHISSIAATSDADYVISVLDRAFEEMNQRGKIFGNVGASNLASFKKKTGLTLPRVVIVMDEVESTFKLAGRKAAKIAEYIDNFVRLGRAAGYHVIMATQNMTSDIPKSSVGQIRVRMCLGANQTTSEAVLGNNGATENIGRIGRLIVNTEAMGGSGNTKPFNIKFQAPFLTDDNFAEEMKFLEDKGNEVGFKRVLSFYDEEDMRTIEEFNPVIEKSIARMKKVGELDNKDAVCLGYPAFVTQDEDRLFKIFLNGKDVENILICSAVEDKVCGNLNNLTMSLQGRYSLMHFTTNLDLLEYTKNTIGSGEIREADTPMIKSIYSLIKKRLYLLYLETLIGSAKYDIEKVEEIMKQDGIPRSAFGNDLLYRRVTAYKATQNGAEHKTIWNTVSSIFKTSKDLYEEYAKYNCLIKPLNKKDFPKACIIFGDISKVLGWGRATKSSQVDELKRALQDACRVGIVFILYSRSMEGMTDLVSGIRYTIFDSPDKKDWSRMKTEEPSSQSQRLAILYDSLDSVNPQRKFKCTLLKPEI